MANHSRLEDIEILRSLTITLVVLGHAIVYMNDPALVNTEFLFLFRFIYSFHMPLFIAISGYVFIYSTNENDKAKFKNFALGKLKRILLPYVAISSLAFLPKTLFSTYALRPLKFNLMSFMYNIFYPTHNTIANFWFLPTLFIILILFYWIRPTIWFFKSVVWKILLTCIFIALNLYNHLAAFEFLNISGVLHYLIYFWLGCLLCYYNSKTPYFNSISFFLIGLFLLVALNLFPRTDNVWALLRATTGILTSFSFAKLYCIHKLNFFSNLNGLSYQIFLLSWFFETSARIVFFQIFNLNYYVVMCIIFCCGLFLPIITTKIVYKHFPGFRILIGMG